MQAARRVRWTAQEYLDREQRSLTKHEFFDGEVYAMAGATLRHNTIAANVIYLLGGLVQGGPCRTFTSDQRIHIAATGLYTYADAGVLCGKAQLDNRLTLYNPLVLVEVLSKSTEDYDRGEKLEHYRNIPALREVLLVATAEQRVDHHQRLDSGQWLLTQYREGAIVLSALGGAMPVALVYDKIDFTEEDL